MDFGTTTTAFIGEIQTQVTANLEIVLAFAAGIMIWMVLKKWVFGGTRRI